MATSERLIFLPLGGAAEIGMNMYLYGYGAEGSERFILVDVGVTFPTMDSSPGVDLIMADTAFIEDRADRLDAIFITHAHEDHIGALGMLYPRLRAPVYVREFTGAVAHAKLEDHGQDTNNLKIMDPWPKTVKVGSFEVGFLPVSHSIPEASGLVIDTPKGRIVHTGDLKLDPKPLVGEPFDEAAFKALGDSGVHALVCDSTNIFSDQPGRSEATLRKPIAELVKASEGLVVATTFASNVARLKTLAQAGVDAGRSVVVLGRAMQRMLGYAHATGVLTDFPPTVELEDAQDIPREHLMMLVTGSQGERRAASAQLAGGSYRGISLKQGDTFLFSSKTIPGNEVSVGRIINDLAVQGVRVIDDSSGAYHVSGHANRPDLARIHALLKPKMMIPMHGEYRHLKEHAEMAENAGIASIIAPNGAMVDLSEDTPEIVENIETGRIYRDGSRLIGAFDGVVLERIRMATRGHVSAAIVMEETDVLGIWIETSGLPRTEAHEEHLEDLIEDAVDQALATTKRAALKSDDDMSDVIERAIRKTCKEEVGKKPVMTVLINRLEPPA